MAALCQPDSSGDLLHDNLWNYIASKAWRLDNLCWSPPWQPGWQQALHRGSALTGVMGVDKTNRVRLKMEEVIRIKPGEFGKQPTCPGKHLLQVCWPALPGCHWTLHPGMWVWGESTTWHELIVGVQTGKLCQQSTTWWQFQGNLPSKLLLQVLPPWDTKVTSGYWRKIVNVIYANLSVTMMAKRPGTEPSLLSIHFFTSSMTLIWVVVCASLKY